MSIDGSLIEKESPPPFVTHRKGNLEAAFAQNLRAEIKTELQSEFKDFETRITSTLDTWFAKHGSSLSRVIEELNEIKSSVKFISDSYEELKQKNEDLTKRVSSLEKESVITQNSSSRIGELESRIDTMEQHARQCNIEIGNLPEKRGENLTILLQDIATLLKEPISAQDLVSIHRVPQPSSAGQRPKNIVVKFTSRLKRDSLLSAARLQKGVTSDLLGIPGPSHKVYFNEHLTLKNKTLFRQTREAAKQHGHRFVWVKHGAILVRKNDTSPVFSVRSENDLEKIRSHNK